MPNGLFILRFLRGVGGGDRVRIRGGEGVRLQKKIEIGGSL